MQPTSTISTAATPDRSAPPSVDNPRVVAVCISAGGIPKRPLLNARILHTGIDGDRHAHEKHNRPERALSLFDLEILSQLVDEGFPLQPGTAGENITVAGLHVQDLLPGTLLGIGDALVRLEQPRKPCYVLDAIDPQLKHAMLGRCVYMASVVQPGTISPGMPIQLISPGTGDTRELPAGRLPAAHPADRSGPRT